MHFDPAVTFILVLVIGIVIGLLFDRFRGQGWLSRQVAGGRHVVITSALVGIAGSFIGYNLGTLFRLGAGVPQLVAAAVGAVIVLWLWRMIR